MENENKDNSLKNTAVSQTAVNQKTKKKAVSFQDRLRMIGKKLPFLRSLRLRLFIFTFLIGLIPCLILAKSILNNYEDRVVNVHISEVQTQARILANHLILEGYLNGDNSTDSADGEISQMASFYNGRILVIDSSLRIVKDTYDMSTGKTIISSDIVKCLKQGTAGSSSRYDREDGYIDVVVPISETASLEEQDYAGESTEDQEVVNGVLLVSASTDMIAATLDILNRRALLMEVILGVCVFALSMVVSGVLLKPFERLTRAISDVKNGYSSDKIAVSDYLETEHIVDAFNEVIGRMRALDESRQEFVSNASHELKTPMASMKVLADSLLTQEDVPAEVYRDFLVDIDDEIDRENKIIAELLTLSKMDRRQVKMNISKVDINNLTEAICKRVRPLAQQRDIELKLINERQVVAEVDEVKMTMVFTNLIDNAVKYNVDHGMVTVTINADHKNFTLTVEDTGIGIPKESLNRIFERFYRVDQSRSREVGGTGLGLSITKSAVLLHKGSIEVESTPRVGTKFRVTIPLTYVRTGQEG